MSKVTEPRSEPRSLCLENWEELLPTTLYYLSNAAYLLLPPVPGFQDPFQDLPHKARKPHPLHPSSELAPHDHEAISQVSSISKDLSKVG